MSYVTVLMQIESAQTSLGLAREAVERAQREGAVGLEPALPMDEDALLALNLRVALEQAKGHKPTAAKTLGLSLKTLYNQLAKLEPPATPD